MQTTKPWYTSKTIWASIFVIAASILGTIGMHLDPKAAENNAGTIGLIATLIGGVFTLITRVFATKQIGGTSSTYDPYNDTGDGGSLFDEASANDGSIADQQRRGSNSARMSGPSLALAIITPFAALLMTGCASPSDEYIADDRATYTAIEPPMRAWLKGELHITDLDADEIDSLNTTLDTWEFRLRGFDEAEPVDDPWE